jgi:hypothetical protein
MTAKKTSTGSVAKAPAKRNIITDKLVVEKTGRPMEDWFLEIDKKRGNKTDPGEIYKIVASVKGLEPLGEWNTNLLATTYSWDRGIRQRGEKEGGFEIGVSKTIAVPLNVLYQGFLDDKCRVKWLGKEKIEIRKATENKSARITWSDGETSLSVDFYAKGNSKSQVVVQHQKIKTAEESEEKKVFWAEKLEKLKALLEK